MILEMLRFILLMNVGCAFAAQYDLVKQQSRSNNQMYVSVQLCQKGHMFFYAYVKKSTTQVYLEAKNDDSRHVTYPYLVKGFTADQSTVGNQLVLLLNSARICELVYSQKFKIESNEYHVVQYHKQSQNLWWCDVYKGKDLNFKETDKCLGLLDDYNSMTDPVYNSVDTLIQSATKLNTKPMHAVRSSKVWTSCSESDRRDLQDHHICEDRYTRVKTIVTYYCKDNILGYKVVHYNKNHYINSYTLPNSENIAQKISDAEVQKKICRLFRFAKEGGQGDLYVYVQFLNKRSIGSSSWGLECEKYRFLSDGKNGGSYIRESGAGTCNRYFEGAK